MAHYLLAAYDAGDFAAATAVLAENGTVVYAAVVDDPSRGITASADARLGDGVVTPNNTPVEAFWVVDSPNRTAAVALAVCAAGASGVDLDVRPVSRP